MAGRVIPRARTKTKAALQVTPPALKRLDELISHRKDPDVIGIRLGVRKRGCNGLSYTLDYAKEHKKTDEVVPAGDLKIFIDPQALMTVVGTEMDWVEDNIKSEFVFKNPNAKSQCGCGESFNV